MKAVWKGYLRCSLVTIPVRMHQAVTQKSVHFNLLHQDCGTRIKQTMVCPACGRTLAAEEVVRGYRYGKDLYVTVTDDDLNRARQESSEVIDVLKFIDDRQINPIYYAEAHYLVPDGKPGQEAFILLATAMSETGKTALARIIWRNREQLLALKPLGGALITYTLHYPEEIVGVEDLEEVAERSGVEVKADHLDLAKTIILHLSGDFVPQDYADGYSRTLLQLIQAKVEGREVQAPPEAEREKVVSLLDALQKSVAGLTGGPRDVRAKGRRS